MWAVVIHNLDTNRVYSVSVFNTKEEAEKAAFDYAFDPSMSDEDYTAEKQASNITSYFRQVSYYEKGSERITLIKTSLL